jgi:hypothetical protein
MPSAARSSASRNGAATPSRAARSSLGTQVVEHDPVESLGELSQRNVAASLYVLRIAHRVDRWVTGDRRPRQPRGGRR